MLFLLTSCSKKLKLEKIQRTLIILFYVILFIIKKKQENNHSSVTDWWKYTKTCFKENSKIFSKNSTIQENTAISRQNFLICHIINESNKLNKNLSVMSLGLILSFLLNIGSDI